MRDWRCEENAVDFHKRMQALAIFHVVFAGEATLKRQRLGLERPRSESMLQ